jgi:magnesium-dependent phosphatase 1
MKKTLFVFDLDFTLWDAGGTWCDCTIPPYRIKDGQLLDAEGAHIRLYPDVINIMKRLKEEKRHIAIASRTTSPRIAKQLLKIFDIDKYVDYIEMYPTNKTEHFVKIAAQSKVDFKNMVFFDDEHRNIVDVAPLGVECVYVSEGIKEQLVRPFL